MCKLSTAFLKVGACGDPYVTCQGLPSNSCSKQGRIEIYPWQGVDDPLVKYLHVFLNLSREDQVKKFFFKKANKMPTVCMCIGGENKINSMAEAAGNVLCAVDNLIQEHPKWVGGD